MANTTYKNLIVYQKAKQLTVDLINYFSQYRLPKTKEFIITQLLRSTSSVGANIAEGYGRHYEGSLRQFYSIARGSSFESDYWLEVLQETKNFNEGALSDYSERNVELMKMLTTLMKNAQKT